MDSPPKSLFSPRLLALLLLAAAVLRLAWLSDDAYITFRVVENAVNGLGLTWNPAERVQAYTHPLWLFVLIAGRLLTGELYYSAIFLSVALTIAAVWLIAFRLPAAPVAAVLGLLILTLSRAFIDFATSGLENPLTHLLLAAFLVVWFAGPPGDRRVFLLSLLAALLAVNRSDALVLVAPALAWAVWQRRSWRALGLALLGLLPLLLWTAFALFYYGFPFPNTAYAKLATGIPSADLARQGLAYLLNSLRWDPITLAAIAAALVVAVISRRAIALLIAAGIALYLLYIVRIGGDFMSGRFLTAPLLAAVALLVTQWTTWSALAPTATNQTTKWSAKWSATGGVTPSLVATALVAAIIITLGLIGHLQVPLSDYDKDRRDDQIADERAYYATYTGLFHSNRIPHPWVEQGMELRQQGPAVIEHGNVGFLGYYAGPAVHIVDRNALTDPLLARLPVRDPHDWRIGHFQRDVPLGYVDTLRDGRNLIHDPDLAAFYDPLQLVTRGPLFSRARLLEILRLNTGAYDHHLP